jgi:hypothetical protein
MQNNEETEETEEAKEAEEDEDIEDVIDNETINKIKEMLADLEKSLTEFVQTHLDEDTEDEEDKESIENKTLEENIEGEVLYRNSKIEVIHNFKENKIYIKSKLPVSVEVSPDIKFEFPRSI